MKDSDILPTALTRQPSRVGLTHFEIVADGLIHTASVFGIPPDEQFVSRVGALAFCNGIRLVTHYATAASETAGLLAQSLEIGRSEIQRYCDLLQEELPAAPDPLTAAEMFLRHRFRTDTLLVCEPQHAALIRSIIGESLLAGIYSRSAAPEVYQAFKIAVDAQRYELAILTSRALWWAGNRGIPIDHPFLEMIARRYLNRPLERDLMCPLFAERLKIVLRAKDPWDLQHWLMPGWKEGFLTARFAPDQVKDWLQELVPSERASHTNTFIKHIIGTMTPENKVNLLAALDQYLKKEEPDAMGNDSLRLANPIFFAARAYDFVLRMGMVSEIEVPDTNTT